MRIDKQELYKQALEVYGMELQVDIAKEEFAELIVAISHYHRGKAMKDEVISELADCIIMLEQLVSMYEISETKLNYIKNEKLDRLQERLGIRGN